MSTRIFKCRNLNIPLGERTLIMGILNATPDSFSDGGEAYGLQNAIDRGLELISAGADILDIGGESTRPGSDPVSLDEELERVIPVIEALSNKTKIPISIDTYKSEVARLALKAGAHIVNDISAGIFSEDMPEVVSDFGAGIVLMHIKGTPRDMQKNPSYDNVMEEISYFLMNAVIQFRSRGVDKSSILVDPGIGFGKKLLHNLELMKRLGELKKLASGVLVGPSRKSFISGITGSPVDDRLPETISAAVVCAFNGADVIRVHDVYPVAKALKVSDAIQR
ncbi:MAG: dihydropteroate synthase [Calditrichaeota bacterium]|nr:dihydropteroate synthase [Calditrichota bacterium]